MVQEATKFETLSREEFVAFLEGIGKTPVNGGPAKASHTAFITAFIRAFHSANENPKVFDDWMAAQVVTAEEYAFFEEMYYRRTLKGASEAPASPARQTGDSRTVGLAEASAQAEARKISLCAPTACASTPELIGPYDMVIGSHGLKKMTNPTTNAAAIAMTTTQTQVETPASFFSSMFHPLLCGNANANRETMETGLAAPFLRSLTLTTQGDS